MTYEEMNQKESIKNFIISNYPIVSNNTKLMKSLKSYSLEQLIQLKNMIDQNNNK